MVFPIIGTKEGTNIYIEKLHLVELIKEISI